MTTKPTLIMVALSLTAAAWLPAAAAAMELPGKELPDEGLPRLDENTALTVGRHRLKLGVLAFDYGILENLSVGIDPPAWAAHAVLPFLVPNAHAKVTLFHREQLWLTFQPAVYYADLTKATGVGGSLLDVPLSLFGSMYTERRIGLHGEVMYGLVEAFGSGDVDRASVAGAAATRSVQLGAMVEYRYSPVVAFTLRGRLQAYTGALAFQGTGTVGQFDTVQVDARLNPATEHPWMVLPGVAFLWKYVHLTVGVGYGNYFIPGINIANATRTVVPDLSLSVLL